MFSVYLLVRAQTGIVTYKAQSRKSQACKDLVNSLFRNAFVHTVHVMRTVLILYWRLRYHVGSNARWKQKSISYGKVFLTAPQMIAHESVVLLYMIFIPWPNRIRQLHCCSSEASRQGRIGNIFLVQYQVHPLV